MKMEGGAPIYEQLCTRITELIANGTLSEGEKLPAVREVAKSLGINPNTVQKAYAALEGRGLIYSIPAKGSYVAKSETTAAIIREKIFSDLSARIDEALSAGIAKEEIVAMVERLAAFK
ncbi:MAG: GntR family transcriptional regulator [Bacteroides sp.]|nr:GntR family transcriptional regulator [Eubacterium sp.]MCM1417366.1 GntR family transcriptional regulator [Roseburia sp.]MCM1461442.1 GntR family transcriptional regulator [Bacteroides sp.]